MKNINNNRRLSSLGMLSGAAMAATVGTNYASAAVTVHSNINDSIGFARGDDSSDIFTLATAVVNGGFQIAASQFGSIELLATNAFSHPISFKTQGAAVARPVNAGAKFSDAPAGAYPNFAYVSGSNFSSKYYEFSFLNGTKTDYGWILGSLASSNGSNAGKTYTIQSYAFDDSGAQLPAGATSVPEPASTGVILAGLLVTGATGVRRHKRATSAVAI